MTTYSKYNIVYRLQKWMDSVPGQTFLNYAYSWGASIVILGTLFKLTHLPGANFMLFAGMGTEVVVFFLSAFDRPFDKTAEGRDLPTHVDEVEESGEAGGETQTEPQAAAPMAGTTVFVGSAMAATGASPTPASGAETPQPDAAAVQGNAPQGFNVVAGTPAGGAWVAGQQQEMPELAEAQGNYVEELKKLTEMLQKVSEQSSRLTRDSEEMENLNRTLTGICKVYEMQLKGASQQIGTIDQINEQSRKMAAQIEQLNSIYARMIEAMTVNMRAAAPSQGTAGTAL